MTQAVKITDTLCRAPGFLSAAYQPTQIIIARLYSNPNTFSEKKTSSNEMHKNEGNK